MIQNIVVLGAGSAGLLTAITLRRKLPLLKVRIVRSREIGVIGVGEGTTPLFPQMLFDYLRLERGPFFAVAPPAWKHGGHFFWGSRRWFDYPFDSALTASSRGCRDGTGSTAMKSSDRLCPRSGILVGRGSLAPQASRAALHL